MASRYLDQEARLVRLAGALGCALLVTDPYCRRFAYGRRGQGAVDLHDDLAATRRAQLGRAVLAPTEARRHRRLPITDFLDKGSDVIALAAIITVWCLVYCLVCPPAHAAIGTPLTDVSLSFAAVLLPFIVAGLLVAILTWHDRGLRMPKHEDEPPLFDAPPTAPVLASLDQQLREADGA